ncbi:MAG: hypothetical protein AAF108_07200 [Planctomycetota bacterium]
MGASFNFFRVEKFPQASAPDEVVLQTQDATGLRGTARQTRVAFTQRDVYGRFERFKVLHETLRKTHGRIYEGDEFDEFFQLNEFDIFYDRERCELVCNCGKKTAKNLVDSLNSEFPVSFHGDYMEINFNTVKPRLKEISGAWVSNLQAAHVNVMALFGKHVDRSDFYRQAETIGSASSLLIAFEHQGTIHPVILSRTGGIAFPSKLPETQYFDILDAVRDSLLDGALSTVKSMRTKKEERAQAKADEAD